MPAERATSTKVTGLGISGRERTYGAAASVSAVDPMYLRTSRLEGVNAVSGNNCLVSRWAKIPEKEERGFDVPST
jgi:hypothetical protein